MNRDDELKSMEAEGETPMELESAQMITEETTPMPEAEAGPQFKRCIFCRETIPIEALACKYCHRYVAIAEGSVFKQYYNFFFASLFVLLGTFLPFTATEGANLDFKYYHTAWGAIFLLIGLGGVLSMALAIYSRRLLLWPIFMFLFPFTWCIFRFGDAMKEAEDKKLFEGFSGLIEKFSLTSSDFATVGKFFQILGPGYILIFLGSFLVLFFFITSVFSAGKAAKKKQQERAAARASGGGGRASRKK